MMFSIMMKGNLKSSSPSINSQKIFNTHSHNRKFHSFHFQNKLNKEVQFNNNNNNNNNFKPLNAPFCRTISATAIIKSEDHSLSEYQMIESRNGPVRIAVIPSVRRIAREHKINLTQIKGSGKGGRILKEDVLSFLNNPALYLQNNSSKLQQQNDNAEKTNNNNNNNIERITRIREDKEVVIKGIQKQMVKSMTAAALIPHFGYREEIVVNEIMKLRSQMKETAKEKNIKLSYLPFFLKACSMALKEFPALNAHTNTDASSVTLKGSHNIGIAMDTPAGLMVPNIKNVQDRSIFEIAQDINRLQALGKDGKIPLSDMKDGTITLSNIGSIGGTYASPVLFLPEVAIGAIGKIQRLPKLHDDGSSTPINVVKVSWSADHRVIDGATMARFVSKLKHFIENPMSMFGELR